MSMPRVWTFFYGSYINLDVLKEADLVPEGRRFQLNRNPKAARNGSR